MLHLHDAGLIPYRDAWDMQLRLHDQVLSGQYPRGALILVEHPAVITIGRRANAARHLLASPELLKRHGIDLVETDRGGDITFHGPGQLVAYPILPLNVYGLNLHAYMRLLEQAVIDTLASFAIRAFRDPSPEPATGVWADLPDSHPPAIGKNLALGIKVRRWTSLHGIALNVTTDLAGFALINPCGLSRPVTSVRQRLGVETPDMAAVKEAFVGSLQALLQARRPVTPPPAVAAAATDIPPPSTPDAAAPR